MKFFLILFLAAILVFTGVQIYGLYQQRAALAAKTEELNKQIETFNAENEKLKKDIEYFNQTRNVAKESKTQFNYRAPDEKLFILVPASSTPTQ